MEQLGIVILSGNNPQDIKLIEDLIDIIVQHSRDAEVKIEMVPVEYGDATVIVNILNQLYTRVSPLTTGNVLIAPRGGATGVGTGALQASAELLLLAALVGQAALPIRRRLSQPPSLFLLPLPRLNMILVAARRTHVSKTCGIRSSCLMSTTVWARSFRRSRSRMPALLAWRSS